MLIGSLDGNPEERGGGGGGGCKPSVSVITSGVAGVDVVTLSGSFINVSTGICRLPVSMCSGVVDMDAVTLSSCFMNASADMGVGSPNIESVASSSSLMKLFAKAGAAAMCCLCG